MLHSSVFESDGWWFDVDRDRILFDSLICMFGCILYDGCCCIVWLFLIIHSCVFGVQRIPGRICPHIDGARACV